MPLAQDSLSYSNSRLKDASMAIKHRSTNHQASHIHPERAKQLGLKTKKPKKPKEDTLPTTLSSLKRQVRDIRRLLNGSETLPETIRLEKERALAAYTQNMDEIYHSRQRQQMIKKYHMVRFFERQKATRRLKKLQKWLRTGVDDEDRIIDEAAIVEEIEEVKTDLDYAIYSPLNEKYVSLYPPRQEGEQAGKGTVKPPMWYIVQRCAEEGTLEDLREGRVPKSHQEHKDSAGQGLMTRSINGRIVDRKGLGERLENKDDDDEGGFFESLG